MPVMKFLKVNKRVEITYIIGHYNSSVNIIDLVSHTTWVVCLNFVYEKFLFTLRAFARNMLRGSRRRNILSCFVLLEIWGLKLGLPFDNTN